MKTRVLMVGVFISVIAVFGNVWAETYIPEINTLIKAKDGEARDLAADADIVARENFYVILEACATVKSAGNKKTSGRDSVYATIIIEDSSNILSVWIDSAKTYCAEFMEATEGWSKADAKRYSVNYDYMQQLRAQVRKSSAKVYLIAVPVNGGRPRVTLGCRDEKAGQVKIKVAFLDKDVSLSFYQEYTLTITDPAQEICKKADNAYQMKDYATALELYTKAANQGYTRAQFSLGYMYETGEGVAQNPAEAAQWYQRAAEQGYAVAQFYLGNMYEIGDGVGKNYNAAVLWYQKAAEQGYANAQYGLGLMYYYGRGVAQKIPLHSSGSKGLQNKITQMLSLN